LAPFLFLLVAEGFSGLMKNAVDRNLFKGFEVKRGGTVISHLQYADDTSIENLWTLKALLRGFELVSGLKVSFHKSCLMGINVSTEFLGMASTFRNCKVGSRSCIWGYRWVLGRRVCLLGNRCWIVLRLSSTLGGIGILV
jgi:hypothetical protein